MFGSRERPAALRNPVHDSLADRERALLGTLDADPEERRLRLVEGVTHYHVIIEGVQANTGYQIFQAVFGHRGVPGYRVNDVACAGGVGGLNQLVDDRRVHGVELGRRVVERIEGVEGDAVAGELLDRRMTAGPREAPLTALNGRPRPRSQQIDPGRPEPNDDDPADPLQLSCRSCSGWPGT